MQFLKRKGIGMIAELFKLFIKDIAGMFIAMAVLSVFGLWKIVEIIIWVLNNVQIGVNQ